MGHFLTDIWNMKKLWKFKVLQVILSFMKFSPKAHSDLRWFEVLITIK